MEEKETKTHFDFFFHLHIAPMVLSLPLRHTDISMCSVFLDCMPSACHLLPVWEGFGCERVKCWIQGFGHWHQTLQWYIEFERPLPLLWPEQCSQQCPQLPVHGVWWASTGKARTEACLFHLALLSPCDCWALELSSLCGGPCMLSPALLSSLALSSLPVVLTD